MHITHNEFSDLSVIVEGPATVSFYWKVSSEPTWDDLGFSVDGVHQLEISGEVDWTLVEHSIPSGEHTLRWVYGKDPSDTFGADAGWVDFLSGGTLSTNTPPMANDDSAAVTVGGSTSTLDSGATSVLANDVDANHDSLNVNITPVSGPSFGTLTLAPDGSFTYVHGGSGDTHDSFVYEIYDINEGVDTATVEIRNLSSL